MKVQIFNPEQTENEVWLKLLPLGSYTVLLAACNKQGAPHSGGRLLEISQRGVRKVGSVSSSLGFALIEGKLTEVH